MNAVVPPAPVPALPVPAIVADMGEAAAQHYVEFFAAAIRNSNTRRAYARACGRFLAWCGQRGLALPAVRPFHVAAWVGQLQGEVSAPSVKQQLAAVRMLCDWLVIGQVLGANPAPSVRGPRHVVKVGRTPVLEGTEWRTLMNGIPVATVGLPHRKAAWAIRAVSSGTGGSSCWHSDMGGLRAGNLINATPPSQAADFANGIRTVAGQFNETGNILTDSGLALFK